MRLTRAHLLAILWTCGILAASLLPASSFGSMSIDTILPIDKIVHFTFYFGFVILWLLALPSYSLRTRILVLFIGIVLGAFMEVLQLQMRVGRSFDIADIGANSLGAVSGIWLIPFIGRTLPLVKKYLPFLRKVY
mgnify:CR=1 FL=1